MDRAPSEYFISVVIPCYNQARFLPDAVESIVGQTYPRTEILIVNDGSPDDTSMVARELIRKHPRHRIQLLEKPNGGLADARNHGVKAASGGWILPLDADDLFENTFLEKAVEALQQAPTRNLVFSDAESFGARTGVWRPEDYSLRLLVDRNLIVGAAVYARELWSRAGGYERALPWGAEDWSFWLGCARLGLNPHRIEGALFKYRQHTEPSMLALMMQRWLTVEAMVRTLHSHWYDDSVLLVSQARIAAMDDETLKILGEKERRFDDLAFPCLWTGLRLERERRFEEALERYQRFQRSHFRPDWQPVWRQLLCNVHLRRLDEVRRLADELRSFRIEFKVIQGMLQQIGAAHGAAASLASKVEIVREESRRENEAPGYEPQPATVAQPRVTKAR